MGRMKDLYIDLQNEYGQNLEDLPEGFSMEEYVEKAMQEKQRDQLFCQQYADSKNS